MGLLSENTRWRKIGAYKSGEEDGTWKLWDDDDKLIREINYKDGILDGVWKSWYENGQLESEGIYKSDKPDGIWKSWYKNGKLHAEGLFKTGLLISYKSWFKNGNQEMVEYFKGKKSYKEFYLGCLYRAKLDLNLPIYCDDEFIRDGEYQEWYENGKMKEFGNYKSDKQDGLWRSWYKNGKLQEMGTYKDGYKDGVWKTWCENGKLESTWQYDAEVEKRPKKYKYLGGILGPIR